jgi:signal peptidase II
VSETARSEVAQVDVRVGSTANALQPISSAERSLAAGPAQWLALVAVAGAAVFADQLTKQVVGRTLAVGERVDLVGPVSIHHVENSGIAFGLFASRTTIVIAITAVAVGWMLWFFARSGRRHPVLPVGLGLVLGGSIANLVDRIRLGRVTDFLDLEAWPASTSPTRSSWSAS